MGTPGAPAIHLNNLFTATSGPGVVPGTTNDGMSESCVQHFYIDRDVDHRPEGLRDRDVDYIYEASQRVR
jgi:hypothetical protein